MKRWGLCCWNPPWWYSLFSILPEQRKNSKKLAFTQYIVLSRKKLNNFALRICRIFPCVFNFVMCLYLLCVENKCKNIQHVKSWVHTKCPVPLTKYVRKRWPIVTLYTVLQLLSQTTSTIEEATTQTGSSKAYYYSKQRVLWIQM